MSRHSYLTLVLIALSAVCVAAPLWAAKTEVGGHVKLVLFDDVYGQRTGTSVADPIPKKHQYGGFSFTEMILYVSSELTDRVSVDLQPFFSASTGATPQFGKDIGAQRPAPASIEPEFHGWVRAAVKVALPHGYEVSAGIVKPRFTWEYGGELFWEDEYNGSKFATNNYLGAMHETGIEVYKGFEMGNYSLPAYLYVLNGGYEFGDNNNRPMVMIHAEPEFGALRLLGSLAGGRYDDDLENTFMRWAAGAAYEWKNLSLRGEYAGGVWKDSYAFIDSTVIDAKPKGFYVKASYRYAPWGRVSVNYNVADHNFSGFFYTGTSVGEKYTTITPVLQFYASESSVILLQGDIANWEKSDGSQKLDFSRITLGWRTTF